MTGRVARGFVVFAAASAWYASTCRAAEAAELRKLFPTEAEVFVAEGGLSRLDLPVSVLESCRPDLSDLRLFDAHGGEVPFFVDSLRPLAGVVVSRNTVGKVVNVRREEVRRETGPPLRRESYDVEVPREAPELAPAELLIDVRRALFVARVVVFALPDGGGEVPLVADGSIFRTGGVRPVSRTVVELPKIGATRIRVTLESEESAYLDPVFELRASRRLARPGRISVPLRTISAVTGDGKTTVEVARPRSSSEIRLGRPSLGSGRNSHGKARGGGRPRPRCHRIAAGGFGSDAAEPGLRRDSGACVRDAAGGESRCGGV